MFRRWLSLTSYALAALLFAVNAAAMNAIEDLVAMGHDTTPSAVGWAADAYLIALAGVLIPLKARRSVFVSAVALFGLASLVIAFTEGAGLLIGARAVQGLAAAVALRAGLALLVAAFQGGRMWPLVAAVAAAIVVGYLGGVVWGAYVAEMFSYRWIFLANVVPVALVAATFVPRAPQQEMVGAPAS
ncbi:MULTISPECIES: MFS transporter [Nonomuraea]|uniref:MFS transporter n=1 Tax=Nonomuraea mangrovi TaxID=2316207 RepID=A0ABW4T0B5_9ACTN